MIKISCIQCFMVLLPLFCHSFLATFVGQFVTLPTSQIQNRKTSFFMPETIYAIWCSRSSRLAPRLKMRLATVTLRQTC